MTEISFEHFDPELELGNLDENGRPIRPRKKPGRKPKPPSPAQRKAQNRAAQRAFRERKRREMREAEATVKRCIHLRDQAVKECKVLRRKVKELQFENNYLKGYVLTLKLACNANAVDVPSFWETGHRDDLGSETLMFSKLKDVPQTLEFFLDNNMHIISADEGSAAPADMAAQMAATATRALSSTSTTATSATTIPTHHDSMLSPSYSHHSVTSADTIMSNALPKNSASQLMPGVSSHSTGVLSPQMPSANFGGQLEPAFFQHLMQADFSMGDVDQARRDYVMDYTAMLNPTSEPWRAPLHNFTGENVTVTPAKEEPTSQVAYGSFVMPGGWNNPTIIVPNNSNDMQIEPNAPLGMQQQHPPQQQPQLQQQQQQQQQRERKIFPPMTPVEFVKQMRYMRSGKGKAATTFFTPTELQRRVRHDLRIDIIPGASMRDHMILFQDYYDANELFNFLIDTAMFLGGSPGNADCWFVPPLFFQKYWFLCPNHKPLDRLDNAIDVVVYMGQKMQEKMMNRKQMYIEREKYYARFPSPDKPYPGLEQGVDDNSDGEEENAAKAIDRISDDTPVEIMMNAFQALPRLTSPSAFP